MLVRDELADQFHQLQAEGARLAGRLDDLAQRAAVYHHLYEHSGGNFVFPLIASHGALWARGYFQFGFRLAERLVWQYGFDAAKRELRLRQLAEFADAFRDVNRRVCADTYAKYHFTRRYGDHPAAAQFIDGNLLAAIRKVHAARESAVELADAEKREVFEAFFYNEQQAVVGPSVNHAAESFEWRLMRFIALKPLVRFAYFPPGKVLWFRHFQNERERIRHGLQAFDWGAQVGFAEVTARLQDYEIMPAAFFQNSAAHFDQICNWVLTGRHG
ncbi:MAG: hypothetical protein WEA31_08330 [Pirellulales bacterium]